MSKFLVIVESPAKSKTIYKILGAQYVIKASMGHIFNLPEKNLGIDIHRNFEPTYEVIKGREKVVKELQKLAKKAEKVYLATDLDREGEAIAAHLMEALKIPEEKAFRVIFNEITPTAIRQAFDHPGKVAISKVNAQKTRRILDRLVGYKISPLLWKKIMSGLSAGRVQSVALRLVVERELEIQAFNPEEYWEIDARVAPEGKKKATKGKTKTPDEFVAKLKKVEGKVAKISQGDRAHKLVADLKEEKFTVSKVVKKEKKVHPSPPFITSTLQQRASTAMGFSPKKTMMIAQQLYEGVEIPEGSVGLITYMRTDSVNISKVAQKEVRTYIKDTFGTPYLPSKPRGYKSRSSAQEAHEAIRPTSADRSPQELQAHLSRDQFRLYKLIWERFVACQMTPAKYDTTSVEITAGSTLFQARGRILKFDGFLKVYGAPEDEKDQLLPDVEEGQELNLLELIPTQHFTKAPPRYTEASLVRTLEKEGIGRPSTYAVILSNIQSRKYIVVEKRAIRATDLGILLVQRLQDHFSHIMDLKFTSQLEGLLDKVEEEKEDWHQVLSQFYDTFLKDLQKAEREMKGLNEDPPASKEVCEECGKVMNYLWARDRKGGIGKFLGCSGYPECKHTRSLDGENPKKAPEVTKYKCKECKEPMVLRHGKNGQFLGCSKYPACKFTITLDKEGNPLKVPKGKEKCDKCGEDMAIKFSRRGPFLACTSYPKCKNALPLDGKKKAPQKIDLECDKCGKPMAIKYSRRGPFVACTGYPECKNTKPMSEVEGQIKQEE